MVILKTHVPADGDTAPMAFTSPPDIAMPAGSSPGASWPTRLAPALVSATVGVLTCVGHLLLSILVLLPSKGALPVEDSRGGLAELWATTTGAWADVLPLLLVAALCWPWGSGGRVASALFGSAASVLAVSLIALPLSQGAGVDGLGGMILGAPLALCVVLGLTTATHTLGGLAVSAVVHRLGIRELAAEGGPLRSAGWAALVLGQVMVAVTVWALSRQLVESGASGILDGWIVAATSFFGQERLFLWLLVTPVLAGVVTSMVWTPRRPLRAFVGAAGAAAALGMASAGSSASPYVPEYDDPSLASIPAQTGRFGSAGDLGLNVGALILVTLALVALARASQRQFPRWRWGIPAWLAALLPVLVGGSWWAWQLSDQLATSRRVPSTSYDDTSISVLSTLIMLAWWFVWPLLLIGAAFLVSDSVWRWCAAPVLGAAAFVAGTIAALPMGAWSGETYYSSADLRLAVMAVAVMLVAQFAVTLLLMRLFRVAARGADDDPRAGGLSSGTHAVETGPGKGGKHDAISSNGPGDHPPR